MHVRSSRLMGYALISSAVCGTLVATANPGYAAPMQFTYGTAGETHILGLDAKLPLGPGKTDVEVDLQTGSIGARITLPESRAEFTLFGVLPTHAKVKITQASNVAGTFRNGSVNVAGNFGIQITEVGHYGFGIPLPNCKTTEPVHIELKSDGGFQPATGGKLTGTYRLPKFADCGFDTEIINGLVTGKDNTIGVTLTKN